MKLLGIKAKFSNGHATKGEKLTQLLKRAIKGELSCKLALIESEGIETFPDHISKINKSYIKKIQEISRKKSLPQIYVYPEDGKFVMSDEYSDLITDQKWIICVVLGEAKGKYVIQSNQYLALQNIDLPPQKKWPKKTVNREEVIQRYLIAIEKTSNYIYRGLIDEMKQMFEIEFPLAIQKTILERVEIVSLNEALKVLQKRANIREQVYDQYCLSVSHRYIGKPSKNSFSDATFLIAVKNYTSKRLKILNINKKADRKTYSRRVWEFLLEDIDINKIIIRKEVKEFIRSVNNMEFQAYIRSIPRDPVLCKITLEVLSGANEIMGTVSKIYKIKEN